MVSTFALISHQLHSIGYIDKDATEKREAHAPSSERRKKNGSIMIDLVRARSLHIAVLALI